MILLYCFYGVSGLGHPYLGPEGGLIMTPKELTIIQRLAWKRGFNDRSNISIMDTKKIMAQLDSLYPLPKVPRIIEGKPNSYSSAYVFRCLDGENVEYTLESGRKDEKWVPISEHVHPGGVWWDQPNILRIMADLLEQPFEKETE